MGKAAKAHSSDGEWQRCSRHQRNHFAMMPHAGGVGTSGCRHQAQGRPPWLPMHRDGDLIPSSMTNCLAGYFAEDRYIPRPENCAPAHLCGLVLRVGGLGTSVFFRTCIWEDSQGPPLLRGVAAALKASAKPFRYDAACAQRWYLRVPASGPGSTALAPNA